MTDPTAVRRPLLSLAALAGLVGLAACTSAPAVTGGIDPADYRQMHPIVLAPGDQSLEVFATGGPGLIGPRQIADVRAFAAEYRRTGQGPLRVAAPLTDPAAAGALPAIRRALAEGGVTRATFGRYQPEVGGGVAPVRLSFTRLKAGVAGPACGQWPSDLGGTTPSADGSPIGSWENRPWENFGCSTQQALAAQVADPLDLVRARQQTPVLATRRVDAVTKWGAGTSPATTYPDEGKGKISTSVGQ